MATKRKRQGFALSNGFATQEQVSIPSTSATSPWGWVGREATDITQISQEHRASACNLSSRNENQCCLNKFSIRNTRSSEKPTQHLTTTGELNDDIIVISDDEEQLRCSKKACRSNPFCLNYLGQEAWEDGANPRKAFIKAAQLADNPLHDSREPGIPVGLKNLGATCYANASLQVWFRDPAFREGVYSCEPPDNVSEEKYKDSPIFQLQVTFAALQEGIQRVFNPMKLVESLQLRTSEQQDSQEFSKLFMSHLDTEFKKQSKTSLKSLVTDQFQGSQVYGTICHSCNYRSEKKSYFLELEVNLRKNAKLEDCISDSLLPELLSADNQYLCSACESLQDATRYLELRELPPVLHFSLMRFVYDLETMERKKSKGVISFPSVLDMKQFLGSEEDRQMIALSRGENVYDLQGVLLHKGASAYHGHYEAQVYDSDNGAWFQFNDESVTAIKSLESKTSSKSRYREDNEENTLGPEVKRANGRKRQRIEDSDDDEIFMVPRKYPQKTEQPNFISSRDAYMLIYKRRTTDSQRLSKTSREDCEPDSTVHLSLRPSERAMRIIRELNETHEKACAAHMERSKEMDSSFAKLRDTVRGIYSSWSTTPNTDAIVLSQKALIDWLSRYCIEGKARLCTHVALQNHPEQLQLIALSNEDVTCEHGFLDPQKSKNMKCIDPAAYYQLTKETHCVFEPVLRVSDACLECVVSGFKEEIYDIEHPLHVKQFDQVSALPHDSDVGYWVSKKWLKDWRLNKPRMHVGSMDDPAPDSTDFKYHVRCEHGGVALNTTNRKKISAAAVSLLQNIFPDWQPLSSNAEPCAICEAEVQISKESKKEIRKQIEIEKVQLRFIDEPSLDTMWTHAEGMDSFAILPCRFVKEWRRWSQNPSENARPIRVDNTPFLCDHGLLHVDPNCPNDLDPDAMIIRMDEWVTLNSVYTCEPWITLSRRPCEEGARYTHEIPVCEDCRTRRKTGWVTAEIAIRSYDPEGTKPKPAKLALTYGTASGARQSKRLRQLKEHGGRRRITVEKSTTVKDVKVMIQNELFVPTICQRLFYHDIELQDNFMTMEDLKISAIDVIDLRETEEIIEIDSDTDDHLVRKRREEGQGFGGTVLGTDSAWSSSSTETPPDCAKPTRKACGRCTFLNSPDASSCQICDMAFA